MNNGYLKWHLFKLRLSKFLIISFILLAVGCVFVGQELTQYAYQQWTQPFDAYTVSAKLENYNRAVALCPGKILAYERIMDTYLQDDAISSTEFESLQVLLNQNQGKIYASREEAVAFYRDLANNILCAYDDTPEARLKNAHGYIEMVRNYDLNNQVDDAEIAICNAVASFYGNYIWATVNVQKPTAAYIDALISQIDTYVSSCNLPLTQTQLGTMCQIAAVLKAHSGLLSEYSSGDVLVPLADKIAALVPTEAATPAMQRLTEELLQWKEQLVSKEVSAVE